LINKINTRYLSFILVICISYLINILISVILVTSDLSQYLSYSASVQLFHGKNQLF